MRRDFSKWQRINRGETQHDEFVDEWKRVSNKDYKDYKKKDPTMKKNEDTAEDNHFDLPDQEKIKVKKKYLSTQTLDFFCESRYRIIHPGMAAMNYKPTLRSAKIYIKNERDLRYVSHN